MAAGPELTKGVEEREARIKEFAMRIRAAANRIAGGKQVRTCLQWSSCMEGLTFAMVHSIRNQLSTLCAGGAQVQDR
jgi:hypothetical protein